MAPNMSWVLILDSSSEYSNILQWINHTGYLQICIGNCINLLVHFEIYEHALIIPNCTSKFIRSFIYYTFNKITPSFFSFELFVRVSFNFWVYFSFIRPCLPNIQPDLCSFQRAFGFRIFFTLFNDILFSQSTLTASHYF